MTIDYKYLSVGDTVCTPIERVFNSSIGAVSGAKIRVTVPPGVFFKSANLSKGAYNTLENYWDLGTLRKNQFENGNICWTVGNDCLLPYTFTFDVFTDSGAACINNDLKSLCIKIDALSDCRVNLYKRITEINVDHTIRFYEDTILVNAINNPITLTLPEPNTVYNYATQGGTQWYIKILNLDNPVTLVTPSGKIVDMSTIGDSINTYEFTLVGQTVLIQSTGTNYIIKRS